MKYLRKFNTEADVKNWQVSYKYVKPNVVLVKGTVSYNVSPLSRVMIQHIDGSLYTTDEWTANGFAHDKANGVAVIGDNAQFVIAKTSLGRMAWSSDANNAVEGVMLTSDYATAETDYAGAVNTARIAVIDTGGAAYQCANFTFPNGIKGYLPALGEWTVAYLLRSRINAAMALIGGTAIPDVPHWSSTQVSADLAWTLGWLHGNSGRSSKSDTVFNHVRAFTALNI